MWKRLLLDVGLVLSFSFIGSGLAFLVYKRYFLVNYYVIDTGKLIQMNVSQKSIYDYMRSNPAIYIDRYCVIYAPPERDVTRKVLDAVRHGK